MQKIYVFHTVAVLPVLYFSIIIDNISQLFRGVKIKEKLELQLHVIVYFHLWHKRLSGLLNVNIQICF